MFLLLYNKLKAKKISAGDAKELYEFIKIIAIGYKDMELMLKRLTAAAKTLGYFGGHGNKTMAV